MKPALAAFTRSPPARRLSGRKVSPLCLFPIPPLAAEIADRRGERRRHKTDGEARGGRPSSSKRKTTVRRQQYEWRRRQLFSPPPSTLNCTSFHVAVTRALLPACPPLLQKFLKRTFPSPISAAFLIKKLFFSRFSLGEKYFPSTKCGASPHLPSRRQRRHYVN